ncbi:VOC family protein [Actinoplanes sp. NPDC049118]|uniref:VOC family protein n=1 Tax=Actinoplanes sp. NPDC049118 TaxID=3155769 RepID=UPI0033C23098
MANEVTVPLLPCSSIDEIADFYGALGFRPTYRQQKPNPYVALQREDLNLHFFGMPNYVPADSYSTCLVVVPDIEALHAAFAAGLRTAYGRVPVSGIPRMTRPRPRRNGGGVTGFSLVDPGGNWIRVTAAKPDPAPAEPVGRLATTLQNAVVLGDSHGDHAQAAKILDGGLRRTDAPDDPVAYVEALVYRAELAMALRDPETAQEVLNRAGRVSLTPDARERLSASLAAAAELASTL